MGGASVALIGGGNTAFAAGRTFVWSGNENLTSFARAGNWDRVWEAGGWVDGPPDGLDTMVVTIGTPNVSSGSRSVWDVNLSGGEFIIRNSKFGVSSFFIDGTLDISASGALQIGDGLFGPDVLTAAEVDMSGGSVSGWLNPETGMLGGGLIVVTDSMEQSGGHVSGLAIQTPAYTLSAGTLSADVDFATLFALSGTGMVETAAKLTGAEGSALTQDGGTMAGTVTGVASYVHSGGSIGGSVSTGVYALTDAAATSVGGVIAASESFDLTLAAGTAIVAAKLSGEGNLIKSGASTVILANTDNDFTGTVAIDAGTLEVTDDALPDYATINVADGATLLMNTARDTVFMGSIEGQTGELVKKGSASLTLGGEVTLGGLTVDAGEIQVGTSLSENTVSFDYAIVQEGASLYVATGATLTIRIPNNLVNNGTFINDGIVNDDLDNTGPFINNSIYNAKVLSNTGTIDNNSGGLWTGDILSNANRISNNTGAQWQGDVVANTSTIYNHGNWSGDVKGNSSDILNAGGSWDGDVLVNSGFIGNRNGASWTGDVVSNPGNINNDSGSTWTGSINNGGGATNYATAIWVGDVIANTGVLFNKGTWTGNVLSSENQLSNEDGGTWNGDIYGNNNAIFNEAGSNWNGDVVGNGGGSNALAQINNHGLWTGDVKDNSGLLFNDGGTWDGNVVVNGGRLSNTGIWTGKVVANTGRISNRSGSSWTGDVLSNAGTITTAGSWDGNFISAGTVIAQGVITGAFSNSGLLQVTGSLGGLATLRNTGIVSLAGSGTTQTLTAKNADFSAGSFFEIDIDASGASDKLIAGTARLNGGTVRAFAGMGAGPYNPDTIYTILSASTLVGRFDAVTTDLAFLAPRLGYDDNAVQLLLKRNDVGFAETGTTRNQQAAAGGAESLGAGRAIYDAALWLQRGEAGQAFNSLSGEAYASFESVSVQSAAVIADVVTARIDRAVDTQAGSEPLPIAYADGPAFTVSPAQNSSVWATIYGASVSLPGDGNTSDVKSAMGGVAGGFDGLLGDWRLGAMLHVGRINADVDELNTSGDSTDFGFGVYGGKQWGETRLSFGAAYTRHHWDVSRSAGLPGFSDTLSTDYSTGTAQTFGKLSHAFRMNAVSLIPYASFAYVNQATDDFTETGGEAALEGQSASIDAIFTTLGLGSNWTFVVGDTPVTAKAGLGWRHAYADTPGATRTLAGGDSFYIVGASIPRDTIVLNAGLNLDVSADTTIDMTYDGQIGTDGAESHTLKGVWAIRF